METSSGIAAVSADANDASPDEGSAGEQLVNKLSRAVLLAIGLAVVLAAIAGAGVGDANAAGADPEGARLGGDFAAFYAAGSIVQSGDIESLYDPVRQEAAQQDLGLDGYLAFAYPPHVAMAYAPLALLGFQAAYLVHTILMAAAFVLAVYLLIPMVPLVARWRWPLLAASFTFLPLITAVGGGQNAALSVLLLTAIWRFLHDDREVVAGVAIGLLIFRPQYAIPMLGLVLLSKHWRAVVSAVATIAITWAATAVFRGMGWLTSWWVQVGPFVDRDAEVNAANSISTLGFLQAVWSADSTLARVAGVSLAAAAVMALMYLWSQPERFTLAQRMGAAAIGLILISPHTMFYDASLLLIAGAALLAESTLVPARLFAAIWSGALTHLFADWFGATPLAVLVMGAFAVWLWHVSSSSDASLTRPIEELA